MFLKVLIISVFAGISAAKLSCANLCHREKYYCKNPSCIKPANANLDRNVTCAAITAAAVGVSAGTTFNGYGLFYNLMGSKYYFGRFADALGIWRNGQCPTDVATLANMDLTTPWSGTLGVATDQSRRFKEIIKRICTFPTPTYPFLCTGKDGTSGTNGYGIGTISYNILLHDDKNQLWSLGGQCWNAKSPGNPAAVVETGVSFNLFSLKKTISKKERKKILAKLKQLGFDTSPANLIEPRYSLP